MGERRNAASLFTHSLKTPLSSVKVASQLLLKHLQGKLDPKNQQLLEMILRNASTLEARINAIVDVMQVFEDRVFVELTENQLETIHELKDTKFSAPPQPSETKAPEEETPEETATGKVTVHADPEIADLIPKFLENRQKDIHLITAALEKGDWDTVRLLGHSMKGAGGGYGFAGITDIGKHLEDAAKIKDASAIRTGLEDLETYLNRVEVIYDEL
jgi:HPt (histidine-containing phosphotransfer) domain-containing protein